MSPDDDINPYQAPQVEATFAPAAKDATSQDLSRLRSFRRNMLLVGAMCVIASLLELALPVDIDRWSRYHWFLAPVWPFVIWGTFAKRVQAAVCGAALCVISIGVTAMTAVLDHQFWWLVFFLQMGIQGPMIAMAVHVLRQAGALRRAGIRPTAQPYDVALKLKERDRRVEF